MKLIGVDFESSGSDPWGNSVPIQIGLAIGDSAMSAHIGGWDWNEFEWSEEAYQVHKIAMSTLEDAEPVWKVDIRVANWLLDQVGSRMWNVPVGFNVAGFDRQFITRWMPNVNRLLSYRSIDLGALCFLIGGTNESGYIDIKRQAKAYAELKLGDANWHDAMYDAKAALYAYDFLTEYVA